MYSLDCKRMLSEAAIEVTGPFSLLSEEAQIRVTDDALTGMMKFITDKYNQLDFSEIEKSAGDIKKFRYNDMIWDNTDILCEIYEKYESEDPGAHKYMDVCRSIRRVHQHLIDRRADYSALYQSGNGLVQLLYVSLVSSMVYCIGVLVSNTIRFVTTEQGTDCEVLFDEIPSTIKNVHIKNIQAAAADIESIDKVLDSYRSEGTGRALRESVSLATVAGAVLGVGVVFILIPRIIVLIREIIYSIYFLRVKVSDMLGVQASLINTNIESLEAGRGTKKIIARQRRIADTLTRWQGRIAVKMDSNNTLVAMQKRKENATLRVNADSPLVQEPGSGGTGALML